MRRRPYSRLVEDPGGDGGARKLVVKGRRSASFGLFFPRLFCRLHTKAGQTLLFLRTVAYVSRSLA